VNREKLRPQKILFLLYPTGFLSFSLKEGEGKLMRGESICVVWGTIISFFKKTKST